MLSEFPTKHASNIPVTFVTLKRFAVLFFLPSCCVNSLLSRDPHRENKTIKQIRSIRISPSVDSRLSLFSKVSCFIITLSFLLVLFYSLHTSFLHRNTTSNSMTRYVVHVLIIFSQDFENSENSLSLFVYSFIISLSDVNKNNNYLPYLFE